MTRVLLVEVDTATTANIELLLRKENFIVDSTDLGEDALQIGKLYDYDVIILDPMLPDIDGYELLSRLREAKVHTPVLILAARTEVDYRLKGLSFGADDFMTEPFDERELIGRLRAIVRRSNGHSQSTIRIGELAINIERRMVTVDDQQVDLTKKEYAILELLSQRKGKVITKEAFLTHLYDGRDEPYAKIIDVFICKLRKKLTAATGNDHHVETVWGRGYTMRDPVKPATQLTVGLHRPAAVRTSQRGARQLNGVTRRFPHFPPGTKRPARPACRYAGG
jgi:two-component system, cell cycle response regulator CtrA